MCCCWLIKRIRTSDKRGGRENKKRRRLRVVGGCKVWSKAGKRGLEFYNKREALKSDESTDTREFFFLIKTKHY